MAAAIESLSLHGKARINRRERQMDGIKKAKERGVRFGRKLQLVPEKVKQIRNLRATGSTVPDIIRQIGLSKASVYRALGR